MASEPLPKFIYHPDPVKTGAIVVSPEVCSCCARARGYVYAGRIYAVEEVEFLCPWCIADGSAAAKYDGGFVSHIEGEVSEKVRQEIDKRTPGYECWQGEVWLAHCGDGCEFRGEMTAERFAALPAEVVSAHAETNGLVEAWQGHEAEYVKGADISVFEFVCRHCGEIRLHADAS